MKRAIIAAFLVATVLMLNPVSLPSQGEGKLSAYVNEEPEAAADVHDAAPGTETDAGASSRLECAFYNEENFYESIRGYETPRKEGTGTILGGIVTHHLLASALMAQFFSEAAAEKPETVVIIGPNHKRFGTSLVHTGLWEWNTPFGIIGVDGQVENRIVKAFDAHEDYGLLSGEHAVSSLIPYIGYYLPDAKIVPVLLNGNFGINNCNKMVDLLEPLFREKRCLLVSSIDFSHYLTPEMAYQMDEITMGAIRERDYGKIMKLGNDNLDTPPTLAITLMLMDRLGVNEDTLLAHKNSSDITGAWAESTTSYLIYLFEKQ